MDYQIPKRRSSPALRGARITFVAIVLFLLLFGYSLCSLYVDWLWFQEVKHPAVFSATISAKLTLFFGFGILFFLILYFNLWLAQKLNAGRQRPRILIEEREQMRTMARAATRWIAIAASIILAFLVGGNAATHWAEYLQFTHAANFGQADPVFGNDVGYYVFRLPFLSYLVYYAMFTVAVTTIGVAAIHYGDGALDFLADARPTFAPYVRKHVLTLAGVFAILVAGAILLSRYDLLYSDNGPFFGAGYTDLHSRLPAMNLQVAAMLLTSLLCFLNVQTGRPFRLPLIGLAIWAAVTLFGVGIIPGFVQRLSVVPNQFEKEKEYIARDIEFTQRAYGLDKVKEQPFEATMQVTPAALKADQATVNNIRLWDWPQLGLVYAAKQQLKPYYRFMLPPSAYQSTGEYNIDVDRYQISTGYQQVMLAARELYTPGLPENAKTWQNQRLQYTHGYGVVTSPVNRVDEDGLPDYYLSDLPVRSSEPSLKLDRPQIYYGELTNDYVFVGTNQKEFDYPAANQSAETRYDGQGGIPLGGFFRRLAFSVRLADTNMLLSGDLTDGSRILFRRRIRERVQSLAPMLNWDNDPYMVIDGGKLVWMLDGYTLTNRYPYSKPTEVGAGVAETFQQFNYIRNSVKAVVDAYDGTVSLYVFDKADPIIQTWMRIFPDLFTPAEKMPAGLRAHVRYPEDLFRIQRDVYKIYHINDPRVYYQKEDAWEVPMDPTPPTDVYGNPATSSTVPMAPYYVVLRLPGEQREEFMMMTTFTPLSTQNISAWMCAKCDGDDYGQLQVYRFPRGVTINGPQQIIGQAKQQPEISQYQTLMGQQGSKVIYGNLLVIPVDKSLLYAIPVYVQASSAGAATIPAIKQVILATGNHIVMRSTLDEAVAALVRAPGQAIATQPPTGTQQQPSQAQSGAPTSAPDAIRRANQAFQAARQKQQEYNRAIDDLGRALKDLEGRISPR